jgi:hypothetical protein
VFWAFDLVLGITVVLVEFLVVWEFVVLFFELDYCCFFFLKGCPWQVGRYGRACLPVLCRLCFVKCKRIVIAFYLFDIF